MCPKLWPPLGCKVSEAPCQMHGCCVQDFQPRITAVSRICEAASPSTRFRCKSRSPLLWGFEALFKTCEVYYWANRFKNGCFTSPRPWLLHWVVKVQLVAKSLQAEVDMQNTSCQKDINGYTSWSMTLNWGWGEVYTKPLMQKTTVRLSIYLLEEKNPGFRDWQVTEMLRCRSAFYTSRTICHEAKQQI